MTAIFYPDCQVHSPGGQFTLEARSPDNGTINHRDGRPPSEEEFGFKYREHQSEFRYRLLDNTPQGVLRRLLNQGQPNVVWERWQGKDEDSPHELLVSDGGWSVLRTHGFRPEVIAVAPSGKDQLHVRITGDGAEHRSSRSTAPVCSWSPAYLSVSTAGLYWTGDSWRYFFQHQDRTLFVWRTSWGQHLVIDLERAVLSPENGESDPALALALIDQEKKEVYGLLESLSARMAEVRSLFVRARSDQKEDREQHPLEEHIRSVRSAIHLAGVHRLKACIPFLRAWEEIDCPGMSTGSTAMGDWWLEVQYFRPILHNSLRLLGEKPLGFPTYHFRDSNKQRFAAAEGVIDRQARAHQLSRETSAEQVLQLLGAPDHIKRRSHRVGNIYRWTEDWEYDFRVGGGWTTLRITWEEKGRKGLIFSIEEVPAYWLQSDAREAEILQY